MLGYYDSSPVLLVASLITSECADVDLSNCDHHDCVPRLSVRTRLRLGMRLWDKDGERNRRAVLGWISLALVTSAVAVYWLSFSFSFGNPGAPEWDVHFHHWSRISIEVVALGFICGVFGSGKEKGLF